MKIKHFLYFVVPVIFFGCGAYHYISQSQEHINKEKLPENNKKMQSEIKKRIGK